jgi:hypothetical protein
MCVSSVQRLFRLLGCAALAPFFLRAVAWHADGLSGECRWLHSSMEVTFCCPGHTYNTHSIVLPFLLVCVTIRVVVARMLDRSAFCVHYWFSVVAVAAA